MISLDNYKNILINSYKWPIDNNKLEINKRRLLLSKKYNDEYLKKIICDTDSFIKDVLLSNTIEHGYFKYPIEEDTTTYINLDLHGGWMSDTLFIDDNNRIISKYLMKNNFGNDLIIDVICDEIEDISDSDILSFYYRYYIYMQGFSKDIMLMDEKKLVKRIGGIYEK